MLSKKAKHKITNKPWRKVLYVKQGFPDNYTDKSFLWELRRNIKPSEITFKDSVLSTFTFSQELCAVIIFVLTYIYLYNEWFHPTEVFQISNIVTGIGFAYYRLWYGSSLRKMFGHDLRTLLIFLVFGQLFSPVLHTLTDTISTNTIYTTTFFMMLIHLIFFDYGISAAIVSNSLSLNAAVFASICLASRLASAYHAFVLITIAIEIFVLFPLLRRNMKYPLIMSITLILITICLLALTSINMLVLFCCVFVFINVVCPLLFIKYEYYKDNIYGPWDEAIVDDADNINDLIYS